MGWIQQEDPKQIVPFPSSSNDIDNKEKSSGSVFLLLKFYLLIFRQSMLPSHHRTSQHSTPHHHIMHDFANCTPVSK